MALVSSVELAKAHATRRDGPDTGLRWGLPWLEARVPRPWPGHLTIIGADTNVGKTFFALGILRAMAEYFPVLLVSLEDAEDEVGRRCFNGLSHPNLWVSFPRKGLLSEATEAVAEASAMGARYVVTDYAQLVGYDGEVQAWGKADAVSRVVIEYKQALHQYGVAGALTSQLRRRGQDEGGGSFPSMSMLKETSQLEQSAEVVIMLGGAAERNRVKAKVSKSKAGPVGDSCYFRRGNGGVLIPEDADAQDGNNVEF